MTPVGTIRRLLWALSIGIAMMALVAGCNEESTRPQAEALILPALTTPDSVIAAMQVIYNDKTHGDTDRLAAYASLLDSAFVFHFQPVDILQGLPSAWGREDELAAHEGIFGAQSARNVYSLELRMTHDPAQDLSPPEVGRENWQEVFATNIYLRLMFNPEDGLEVNGAQGEFKFPPAENGLFKIGDWTDLPRPGASVESHTWGGIKAFYD